MHLSGNRVDGVWTVWFPHGRAQEILLEELQVEIGYHVKIRGVEVHVLVEECDHEHAADAVTGLGRAAD